MRYNQGGEEKSSYSQKSQYRLAHDMEECRAINPTEEKPFTVNDLVDSYLRFRNKSVQNMINVFERWCSRRLLCISRTEHVTNEDVFNMANTKPTLLDALHKRQLAVHGHLVRKGNITFDLMIGRIYGP